MMGGAQMNSDGRNMIFLCCAFLIAILQGGDAHASTNSYSVAEWRNHIEEAFRALQAQEEKFLSPEEAKSFVPWSPKLRTAVRPDDEALSKARIIDPAFIDATETCRTALFFGVALLIKAKNPSSSVPSPLGINASGPFDQFAKAYVKVAEQCEDGLHMQHPNNNLRARFH
jgi:hypothetical protein